MNIELIRLFGCALEEQPLLPFAEVNAEAVKRGFIVYPQVCTQSVMDYLKRQPVDYTSTFYATWDEVVSKSRLELLFDQLLHYYSTYGTDYSLGNGYVPNDGSALQIPYEKYQVIVPVSVEQLRDKCMAMLCSGVALAKQTMEACADFVVETLAKEDIQISEIKNKEAQTYIASKLGILPTEPVALLRHIIYVTIGETMIIKNDKQIMSIRRSEHPFDFSTLDTKRLEALASIFLRYKPLFIAFKYRDIYDKNTRIIRLERSNINAPVINKLRKMAAVYHKPMKKSLFDTVLSAPADLNEVHRRLPELTPFKVVSLMQAAKDRLLQIDKQQETRLFVIRNQKVYVKSEPMRSDAQYRDYLKALYETFESYLVEKLSKKACVTTFPKTFTLAMPASEKSFVGNMPFGTKYNMSDDNFIGIYWRNEWGTRDFDLSIVDENGRKFGWNAHFYDERKQDGHDIIFSGDMTNADPEATELFYFRRGCPIGMVYVSRFNGDPGSRYKLIVGEQTIRNLTANYMVDPNNIRLSVDIESAADREQAVGCIFDSCLTLMALTTGGKRVATGDQKLLECMKRKSQAFVSLENILRKAGFREPLACIANDGNEVLEPVVLDLTNLDKATLISLMA